jgi:ribosomal protein S18 acetylase RimI-like enzyme
VRAAAQPSTCAHAVRPRLRRSAGVRAHADLPLPVVSRCQRFCIRRMVRADILRVADVQAEAFFEPRGPTFVRAVQNFRNRVRCVHVDLNHVRNLRATPCQGGPSCAQRVGSRGMCWILLHAAHAVQMEVLDNLHSKLRVEGADFVAILVATPAERVAGGDPVGVIEVRAARQPDAMARIADTASDLGDSRVVWGHGWITGMAVAAEWRQCGCASALLAEAERVSLRWGYPWAALRAEEDNEAACALYSRAGYGVLARQRPLWRLWKAPLLLLGKRLD